MKKKINFFVYTHAPDDDADADAFEVSMWNGSMKNGMFKKSKSAYLSRPVSKRHMV